MKELFEKISSYNIFNYLLPGVVFVSLSGFLTKYQFASDDLLQAVFVYYFFGLIISRIGSIIVEPLLKAVRFVKFAPYEDFLTASKKDEKLEVLSETNNMYRTLCALALALCLLKSYEVLSKIYPVIADWGVEALVFGLVVLFLFSYRKQTLYITKRIENNK
ncbi:hypothetical protein KQI65_01900 [bacterium]|nr:hypothetical protein [bacterium]